MPVNPMLLEYQELVDDSLIHLYNRKLDDDIIDEVKKEIQFSAYKKIASIDKLNWDLIAVKTKKAYIETIKK